MKLPTWTELSVDIRRRLIDLASSFAIGPDDALLLPTETQARSIALEMYYCSRMVIEEVNQQE